MLATGTDPRKREEEFSSKVWNSSAEGGGAKSRRWRGRALDLAEDKATSSAAVPSSPLAAEPVRSRRKRILALNKKPKKKNKKIHHQSTQWFSIKRLEQEQPRAETRCCGAPSNQEHRAAPSQPCWKDIKDRSQCPAFSSYSSPQRD